MRSTGQTISVRLYFLDDAEGGAARTLIYAPLADALALAAEQSPAIQGGLYLQTPDDVIAYSDYIEG
ncbi:MAG TPA: hypothetical protein VF649_15130 [Sphingomonas sp.]|jgi:hypothetical protein|uniref:hypothetical protein n=1 Tax=Sphingomonas sp. TaxID=28214 RepID=UPI002EDA2009